MHEELENFEMNQVWELVEPPPNCHPIGTKWIWNEELENFERNQVWELVEPPPNCHPIGTKWIWKNKEGENGMVVRNKSRLVS
jgi:hypothetical protein